MEFNGENSLPYLASAIAVSVAFYVLLKSYRKGMQRVKLWIIAVFIHNIALYIQFIDNGFLDDKFSFIHITLSGIALIFLIYSSIEEYHSVAIESRSLDMHLFRRYLPLSILIPIIYFALLFLVFRWNGNFTIFLMGFMVIWIIFAIRLFISIYQIKQTPTHISLIITLTLTLLDALGSILAQFTSHYVIYFSRVFETGFGIGILFLAFSVAEENKLLEMIEKQKVQNLLLEQTQEKLISQTQLQTIQIIAGGFAHDFNNILTSIIGNLNLIEDYPIFQNEGKESLDDLKSASSQAKNMVNQLLVFSKGQEFTSKDVNDFSELIEITTKFSLRGRKSKPIFNIDTDLFSIYGDPIQISQIIQNLVINADEAMVHGGIIEISAKNCILEPNNQFKLKPGEYILFKVIDSGGGIPEDIQNKIFSRFFTTKPNGKGFGLIICKKIIEDHNGYIGFISKPRIGTEFYFYIPAKAQKKIKLNPISEKFPEYKGTVLILDDNLLVLRVIENLLRNMHLDVIACSESTTFMSTYRDRIENDKKIDLLLVDLTLPGDLGGKEIIGQIRAINPGAYVVVSSGYSNEFVLKNYANYGFNGFLRKPYEKSELITILDNRFTKND
jgi:signal transduction histidine kinase/ActR/RegA family two-component response regulator